MLLMIYLKGDNAISRKHKFTHKVLKKEESVGGLISICSVLTAM